MISAMNYGVAVNENKSVHTRIIVLSTARLFKPANFWYKYVGFALEEMMRRRHLLNRNRNVNFRAVIYTVIVGPLRLLRGLGRKILDQKRRTRR